MRPFGFAHRDSKPPRRYPDRMATTPQGSAKGSPWFLITAIAAWLGIITVYLFAAIIHPDPQPDPNYFGYDGISRGHRVLETAFYFTVASSTVVAIVHTILWLRPNHRSERFAVLRLDALLMIIVTGLVYAAILAPTSTATGWNFANTVLLHYILPPLTVIAWIAGGPRGLLGYRHLPGMLVIPIVWLACCFAFGGITGSYPYSFVNVAVYGWVTVLINCAAILVASTLLGAGLVAIDRAISKRSAAG